MTNMALSDQESCFLCLQPASMRCSKCCQVSFCCDDHRSLHSNSDLECFPCKIKEDPIKGRILAATRIIEPGELIFRETPLTVGNLHETEPVCLTCWKQVDGSFTCEECRLPMCSDECATADIHRLGECSVFKPKGVIIRSPEREGDPHPFYQCVTPLRCLLMKEKEPHKWAAMLRMMDHLDDKPRDIFWEINQKNIVKYLLKAWKLSSRFSELEVNHVIGALEVNAFEIKSSQGGRGRGVFPLTSLMSHACISNARYIIDVDGQAEVRANVQINPGEEITDHYVTPLNGTMYRRTHLSDGWFFHCECPRCCDKTEFGTYSSAFLDSKGCGGIVLPINPLDYSSEWKCLSCEMTYSWETELSSIEEKLTKLLDAQDEDDIKCDIPRLKKLLIDYKSILHSSHYLIIAIKRYMMYSYGRNSDEAKMIEKQKLCNEIQQVYDVICPGLTKERGLTLFEVYSANKVFTAIDIQDLFQNPSDGKRDSAIAKLNEDVKILSQVVSCLRHECHETFEDMILQTARRELEKCHQILTKISTNKGIN